MNAPAPRASVCCWLRAVLGRLQLSSCSILKEAVTVASAARQVGATVAVAKVAVGTTAVDAKAVDAKERVARGVVVPVETRVCRAREAAARAEAGAA